MEFGYIKDNESKTGITAEEFSKNQMKIQQLNILNLKTIFFGIALYFIEIQIC